ncbi:MAG TPA: ATP-binding protein [Jatrophihabitantaceae bacterium]|jgi:anti-sigma regulatory factor (Ser/Thr protein kinase)|nr:ATP-binding protein [Jatrophihabitantaceae bacterium]
MRVPHATTSAALVRHELSADLALRGIDPDSIDEVVLVASELVGNAVRHTHTAEGGLAVEWMLDGSGVIVQVADSSPATPTPRDPVATEPGGRGLHIVEALADDWGVRQDDGGKRVWAHVPVRTSHREPALSGR